MATADGSREALRKLDSFCALCTLACSDSLFSKIWHLVAEGPSKMGTVWIILPKSTGDVQSIIIPVFVIFYMRGSFPLIPTRLCWRSAWFVYAHNAKALRAYREGAESQTEPKHSSECCNIQQLEGEAHDKSKWVTLVSNGYKTCSRLKQANGHRAYTEHNAAWSLSSIIV